MRCRFVLATVVLCTLGQVASGQFQGLSFLPYRYDPPQSFATDISADGSCVVGTSSYSPFEFYQQTYAYRWTAASGMTNVNVKADSGSGVCVSGDGSTVAALEYYESNYKDIYVWTEPTGTQRKISLYKSGTLNGVSGNGSRMVGSITENAGQRALGWEGSGQRSFAGYYSGASAISGDGNKVLGGRSYLHHLPPGPSGPVFWSWDGTETAIDWLPFGPSCMSYDGNVLAGRITSGQGSGVYIWSEATGVVRLGDLGGVSDVSNNGVVIGGGSTAGGPRAFIWDAQHGMRNLYDYLVTDLGYTNLDGWTLTTATGISADGLSICGNGIDPSGHDQAWLVRVPEPASVSLLVLGAMALCRRRGR